MRAIVQRSYGPPDVLAFEEVADPQVADDEVLVRARAASVHADVWHVVHGRPYLLRLMGAGLRRPKRLVPGTDVAGVVDAVGANVTRFRPGDEVFGETVRGMQWAHGGAFAELVAVPELTLARKPAGVTFEEAVTVVNAGLIVMQNLPEAAALPPGSRVLVNGAAGGVSGLAVQLAKAGGATVTGVDHPSKLDVVRRLGADHVIDYTREDFTSGDARYDLVFDIPGNHSYARVKRVLAPGGTYLLIGHDGYGATAGRWLGSVPRVLGLALRSIIDKRLPRADFSTPLKGKWTGDLAEMLQSGQLAPMLDRTFPLAETAEALRYLASGRSHGRVVVLMGGPSDVPGDAP